MSYPQGGGLTAERQAFREHIRLQTAHLFAAGKGPPAYKRTLPYDRTGGPTEAERT